ncbi:uncharacterized protein LOC133847787 [Drosophila sulfurigaster albostrigata]|uniref:uncharacterized protein LOC133847787 n=1 Tax=Drosophila sulfurigaster albostrigata TaxID=89887 RepID=UPI002D21946C|nr:uncharacterized protein LOC133847787 [Drosophila sulfurigaster albostrigata]
MADGFKKYFNGTTMHGRANVAKATYATLAVFYLLYRVRRSKGAPKEELAGAEVEKGPCNCDVEKPEHPVGYCDPHAEPQPPEKHCSVCRDRASERRAREGCNGDPPPPPPPSSPPPPPSSSATAAPRRKCPCEDPHRHIETPKPTTHQSHMQMPSPQEDQVHPAREIIGHMQEAASRALRNVIGAVLGDNSSADNSAAALYRDGEDTSVDAAAAAAAAAEARQMEDDGDGSDYGADSQLNRERRTSPKSCVPTTGGSCDIDLVLPLNQEPQELVQSQAQTQPQSRFRAFEDDFASEMFFEDFDE